MGRNLVMTDPSSKLGEKLLQGWTMLEDACPRCNIPLMRKPKSKDMLCVGCGAQVVESMDQIPSNSNPQNQSPPTPVQTVPVNSGHSSVMEQTTELDLEPTNPLSHEFQKQTEIWGGFIEQMHDSLQKLTIAIAQTDVESPKLRGLYLNAEAILSCKQKLDQITNN